MFNGLSPWHLAIVALVFLILFGSKKLPDAARGLGRSMRIFKSEVSEMQNEGRASDKSDSEDGDAAPRELPKGEQGSTAAADTDGVKKSA